MKYIKLIIEKFSYAFAGLFDVLKNDSSILTQVIIGVIVILGSYILAMETYDFIIIIFLVFIVIVSEIFNSAIEKLADYVCDKEHHELIGRAKDMSSAAVLVMSLCSAIIGFIILSKYLF